MKISMRGKIPAPEFQESGKIAQIRLLPVPGFQAGVEEDSVTGIFAKFFVLPDSPVQSPPAHQQPFHDFVAAFDVPAARSGGFIEGGRPVFQRQCFQGLKGPGLNGKQMVLIQSFRRREPQILDPVGGVP